MGSKTKAAKAATTPEKKAPLCGKTHQRASAPCAEPKGHAGQCKAPDGKVGRFFQWD